MRLLGLIIILSSFMWPSQAKACWQGQDLEEKDIGEIMPEIYAIGIFRVIKNNNVEAKYETLASYSDFEDKQIVARLPKWTMCDPANPSTVGHVYELILTKKDDVVSVLPVRLDQENWKDLRAKAKYKFNYRLTEKVCSLKGGVWTRRPQDYPEYACKK